MATIWCHRLEASDILVRFPNRTQARAWAKYYLVSFNEFDTTIDLDHTYVGSIPYIQVSIHDGHDFFPTDFQVAKQAHVNCWNDYGTVELAPHEALFLGANGEPDGFIQSESEGLWTKETRTHFELDKELDDYMSSSYGYQPDMCTAGVSYGICSCCGTCTRYDD
jgi:hypothetical protein